MPGTYPLPKLPLEVFGGKGNVALVEPIHRGPRPALVEAVRPREAQDDVVAQLGRAAAIIIGIVWVRVAPADLQIQQYRLLFGAQREDLFRDRSLLLLLIRRRRPAARWRARGSDRRSFVALLLRGRKRLALSGFGVH